MSFTTDIYNAILEDLRRNGAATGTHAMRMVTYQGGNKLVFAINTLTGTREAYVALETSPDQVSFPKWHGISIEIAQIAAYGDDYYIRLLQIPQSEDYIFDIVVEDLRSTVEKLSSISLCLPQVLLVLAKWKRFFQSEKDLIMSDEMQAGLYGELTFLRWGLNRIGHQIVSGWAGGNAETHDYYILQHGIEVKSTTKKEPYRAVISSEYQLDEQDVPGRLFLQFYALRKSKSAGESLPQIVQNIRSLLANDPTAAQAFNAKLNQYGYFDEVASLYTTGFHVRDSYSFEVRPGFPRIIRNMYPTGISKITYELSTSQCIPFAISEDDLCEILKGTVMSHVEQ